MPNPNPINPINPINRPELVEGFRQMTYLNKKAFGGLIRLLATLAILLFVPAWTLDYWQAWVYLIVFG